MVRELFSQAVHRTRSRGLSGRFRQRLTFMHRDVISLGAFDFVLRIILARVMGVPFVVNVVCMHLDDRAANEIVSFSLLGKVPGRTR